MYNRVGVTGYVEKVALWQIHNYRVFKHSFMAHALTNLDLRAVIIDLT